MEDNISKLIENHLKEFKNEYLNDVKQTKNKEYLIEKIETKTRNFEHFKDIAIELIDKFQTTQRGFVMPLIIAKQCALICVDEKIAYAKTFGDVAIGDIEEFERIKKEIENYQL